MGDPKISIITVNYNNAKGLVKTIISVKRQTYSNIEYLVIDGNSDDGSKKVIEKEKSYISFSLSERDEGIFNAMNKGIKIATGDFLLFLNSGDVFASKKALNDFVAHKKFKGDIIYGDYQFEIGEKIYPDKLSPQFFMRSSLPHQSTLISKRVFDNIGLYDESFKIIGDRAHFFKAFLSHKFQFTHIKYALTIFDLNGISNSKEYATLKIEEDERMFKTYFGVFYEDYKELFRLKKELKITKGKTILGLINRAKTKIKKVWSPF